jgi:hypothetical protein
MKTAKDSHSCYLDWKLPDTEEHEGRTLHANVGVKFYVTASVAKLDDVEEDTDICDACIIKYLPKEITDWFRKGLEATAAERRRQGLT